MRILLPLLLMLALAGSAEAVSVTGSTWADPEELTVQYDNFARNADGSYERNPDGSLQREPQTFTVHWDMELQCDIPTASPGADMELSPNGISFPGISEGGEQRKLLDFEPRSFNVSWERDGGFGPWTAEGSMVITIINEQAWGMESDLVNEYHWFANAEITNQECFGDGFEGSLDYQNQTLILPGIGGGDPYQEPDGPSTRGVPAPAVPAALALIGLVALKKR